MNRRILVTGSRNIDNKYFVASVLYNHDLDKFDTIVHGDCPTGADYWANEYGLHHHIPVEKHPADWQDMVDLGADICIAFVRPDAIDTKDCMKRAIDANIPLDIYYLEDYDI